MNGYFCRDNSDGMLAITQLTKDDVIIVHQLARTIWPEAFKDILEPTQIEYMLEWMYNVNTLTEQAQTGHLFYMITSDGVPKGFIGLEPNFPDAGTLRIHKLYVQASDHGLGLGKALLLKSLEGLRELGYAYGIIGGVGPKEFYVKNCGAIEIPGSDPGTYIDLLP